MSMTRKLWSLSALATEFGLDRRAVARRIDGINPAGEIQGNPAWHLADVAPALAGITAQGDEVSFDEARRRRAVAEAVLAEMEVERAAGRLLKREDVDAAVIGAFARVRARLLAVPGKAAPLVAGNDAAAASEIIRRAIHDALRELSETSVFNLTEEG